MKRVVILLLLLSVLFGCAENKNNNANNNNSNSESADPEPVVAETPVIRAAKYENDLVLTAEGKMKVRLQVFVADSHKKNWTHAGGITDGNVISGNQYRVYMTKEGTLMIRGDSCGEVEFDVNLFSETELTDAAVAVFNKDVYREIERVVGFFVKGNIRPEELTDGMYYYPDQLPDGKDYNIVAIVLSIE
ncbi:MAG: hypothetical protein II944_09895 [Ruminobacter sp.]|nr:hypothetical protein [Ruminobacter sp.]